jgi:deoxycytidylate deaminase
MTSQHTTPLIYPDAEVVLGLVAPVGTDLGEVERKLEERLKLFNYRHELIKLTELLPVFALQTQERPNTPAGKLHRKMDQGNALRDKGGRADALAVAAIKEVRARRKVPDAPQARCAFVLKQLKHPSEVETLRAVYGPGFFLLGVTASIQRRRKYLIDDRGMAGDEADELIKRDEDEDDQPRGQRTRMTFHLADAFLSIDGPRLKTALWRALDLLFGNTLHTPTVDEHAMFMAFAASLRSADLSRQVGAVVLRRNGEVLATGANDVPNFGGGQYWPDEDPFMEDERKADRRDHVIGSDSNAVKRDEILLKVVRSLSKDSKETSDSDLLETAKDHLRDTGILDLTEFGRAVHAEMAALLSCARVGISCTDAILYSTTFPCHNCTKHLVAAGIAEVVYVEPYAKSKALELHGDAIYVPALAEDESAAATKDKVLFRPFEGIGPRRFMDVFSLTLGDGRNVERKSRTTGRVRLYERETAGPRVPMQPTSYFEREMIALAHLSEVIGE